MIFFSVRIRTIGVVNWAKWREEVGCFGCDEPPLKMTVLLSSDEVVGWWLPTVVVMMIESLKTFDLKRHGESQPRDLRGRTIGYYLWSLWLLTSSNSTQVFDNDSQVYETFSFSFYYCFPFRYFEDQGCGEVL